MPSGIHLAGVLMSSDRDSSAGRDDCLSPTSANNAVARYLNFLETDLVEGSYRIGFPDFCKAGPGDQTSVEMRLALFPACSTFAQVGLVTNDWVGVRGVQAGSLCEQLGVQALDSLLQMIVTQTELEQKLSCCCFTGRGSNDRHRAQCQRHTARVMLISISV